ncbi:hypothetical protein OHT61_25520 [Streptomyces sp. NBC_00178]|uniref:hypothetical protein n=1 Tax=Streptomyces sp. NBC_00178 TaxID=2975672 RepID=UPI002E2D24FA|nr:hypothetical protein [Streptomyces sp. NBC_00178]
MFAASDPYQGHSFTALLAILIAGAAALCAIAVHLCSRLARRSRQARTPASTWRDVTLLASAGALALYLWGCLHLLLLDRQERGTRCAYVDGELQRPGAEAATGDFIPLRLVCRMPDGTSHTAVVPDYINPTIAVLLLLALGAGTVSLLLHRKRQATQRKAGRS